MKSTILGALAGLAWGAVALAGPAQAAAVEVSLVGWGGPEEHEVVGQVVRDFERQHPGIHVKYTQIPGIGYDYLNKVRLMVVAGLAPDVFYVPDGAFGEFASRNTLLNLDPYVAKSHVIKTGEIWPSSLNRYRWNGRQSQKGALYCLPKDIGPNVMFYNKDVFRKRHVPFPDPVVPMTWKAAVKMWHDLGYKEGGIQHYGVSGYPYECAVWSSGAEIISPDKTRWVLDSPKGAAAVQWVTNLGLVEHVSPDASKTAAGSGSSSPGQLFESQIAATHFDGRWLVPHYRKLGFDWDVAPFPVPEKGNKSVSWSGSVGFGIAAKTPHPQEAFQLVEYMAGPEGQTALTKTGLQVPNQIWLAKTDVFLQRGQRPAHAEVFLASARDSRPGPWTDTPNTFWHDVYWTFVGKVFRGEKTAAQGLKEMSPLINQTLRENNTPADGPQH